MKERLRIQCFGHSLRRQPPTGQVMMRKELGTALAFVSVELPSFGAGDAVDKPSAAVSGIDVSAPLAGRVV